MIDNVYEFHRKFDFPLGKVDHLSNDEAAANFRLNFLNEELEELAHALNIKDTVAAFDALLDLAYVTYGTALWFGISPAQWHAGMRAVHNANMRKIRVESAADSKRHFAVDAKKPAGWVGPEAELAEILDWVV